MVETIGWWAVLQMAGLAGVAPALVLFRRLPDRGYAFCKPIGLLTWGYLIWLPAEIGILPHRTATAAALWALPAAAGIVLLARRRPTLKAFLRLRWRYLLAVEALFLLLLAAVAFLRSYVPEIAGTEKPMDFAFLNAVLRSESFPPQDPWLAGYRVSYYYGGYVLNAIPVRLTGIDPAVGFNLALAGTAAMAGSAVFGLGWNIGTLMGRRRCRPSPAPFVLGLLGVALLLLLGSGEGVLELVAAHGAGSPGFWDWWAIEDLRPSSTAHWYPDEHFWWWRATRTTPDTITEFPFFSFLLGDLHPHVMALPLGMTAVAAALGRLLDPGRRLRRAQFLVTALLLGGMAWVNTWDLPTFGFVVVAAWGLASARAGGWRPGRFALQVAALLALAVLLYLPFYVSFRSQASGLLPDRSAGTRPVLALLLWGPPLLLTAGLLLGRVRRLSPELALTPLLSLFALWALSLLLWRGPAELRLLLRERGSAWLTVAACGLLVGGLLAGLSRLRRGRGPRAATWSLAVLAGMAGALLLLGAELVYVRDVFDNRMNTVFKLSFQAWQLLTVAAVAGAAVLLAPMRRRGFPRAAALAVIVPAVLFAAAGLTYTVTALMARTDGFSGDRTLDGLAFLKEDGSGEYELIRWLRGLDADTRIAEAVGRDYTNAGRVAARSGLQSVVGWVGHELQWRARRRPFAGRFEDVELLYSTADIDEALAILHRYAVDYVIVGAEERRRYPAEGLAKFAHAFPVAFSAGEVQVFAVPPPEPSATRIRTVKWR